MFWPTTLNDGVELALVMESFGVRIAGTTTVLELVGDSGGPVGGVPTTVAVFETLPLFRSAWVTIWEPLQVVDAPAASVDDVQVTPLVLTSVTETAVKVTLPVLLTVNE